MEGVSEEQMVPRLTLKVPVPMDNEYDSQQSHDLDSSFNSDMYASGSAHVLDSMPKL